MSSNKNDALLLYTNRVRGQEGDSKAGILWQLR